MIIDGKLIVSKKKKAVLMAELKKLNFKGFPKIEDASKAGELENTLENDEDDGEDGAVGAADYDYLLGVSTAATSKVSNTDFENRCPFGP